MATPAFAEELGGRIRQARIDAGLTAEEMAPQVDVTMGTLLRYERGETKRISFERLASIADVTGKPMSYFLHEIGTAA